MQIKTKMQNLYEFPITAKFKKADNTTIHFCWE